MGLIQRRGLGVRAEELLDIADMALGNLLENRRESQFHGIVPPGPKSSIGCLQMPTVARGRTRMGTTTAEPPARESPSNVRTVLPRSAVEHFLRRHSREPCFPGGRRARSTWRTQRGQYLSTTKIPTSAEAAFIAADIASSPRPFRLATCSTHMSNRHSTTITTISRIANTTRT